MRRRQWAIVAAVSVPFVACFFYWFRDVLRGEHDFLVPMLVIFGAAGAIGVLGGVVMSRTGPVVSVFLADIQAVPVLRGQLHRKHEEGAAGTDFLLRVSPESPADLRLRITIHGTTVVVPINATTPSGS